MGRFHCFSPPERICRRPTLSGTDSSHPLTLPLPEGEELLVSRPTNRRLNLRAVALALALLAPLASAATAQDQAEAFTSAYVARWNLTYGKYQVDIGQYLDALEAFDTAIEMSTDAETRTEAWLQKATVHAVFLDAPDEAIRAYEGLLAQYPNSSAAEAALFRAGMVLFDGGRYTRAGKYFERYLKEYPGGPSRGSAEFMLEQSRAKREAAPTPTVPTRTRIPTTTAVSTPTPVSTAAGVPTPAGARSPTGRRTPTGVPSPTSMPSPAALPLPSAGPSVTQVRVRVFKGHRKLTVSSEGVLTLTPSVATGRSVELTARAGMVSAGAGPGAREVTIRADHPLQVRAGRPTRSYRGSLSVTAQGDTLQVIVRVGIEDYLYGVVTKESVASWPPEALKAQAIASRTYALYQVQHRRDRDYDMVDDEGSQVYGGVEGESPTARRAVDATRGIVLEYRDRPIYAMFTSNAGWHTGDPKYIFDQPLAYLNAFPDPYSPGQQLGRWTRSHSADEVRRRLADIGVKLGPIRAIEAKMTCPSGRIVHVAIIDDRGRHVMRTRTTLARALKLPEILINVEQKGDQFVFAGGGFGHGVGLSQWGAKAMADKGLSAQEILTFYYRGAEIAVADP